MSDREVKRSTRPAMELGRTAEEGGNLPRARRTSVPADEEVLHAVAIQDPERLCVVTRGDRDFVSGGAEALNNRTKDDRVRGSSHVEPNPHPGRRRGTGPGGPASLRRAERLGAKATG